MGHYVAFLVERDGVAFEVQSKRFDSDLQVLNLGDVLIGALPGLHVYIETLQLDSNGKRLTTQPKPDCTVSYEYALIVVLNGVYLDYKILCEYCQMTLLERNAWLLEEVDRLKSKWSDSDIQMYWMQLAFERQAKMLAKQRVVFEQCFKSLCVSEERNESLVEDQEPRLLSSIAPKHSESFYSISQSTHLDPIEEIMSRQIKEYSL